MEGEFTYLFQGWGNGGDGLYRLDGLNGLDGLCRLYGRYRLNRQPPQ